jgi:membrane-associated protease RseP (regulator of RpoE activity)
MHSMTPEKTESLERPTIDAGPTVDDVRYRPNILLHLFLFLLTFVCIAIGCSTFAIGSVVPAELTRATTWSEALLAQFRLGVPYAVLLSLFLLAHEFGHYFAARAHGVVATLPYFLPMPLVQLMPFGTLGAVIRTRTPILTRRALFDIGVAGPIAGFVVALAYLVIGTVSLGGIETIHRLHPEYGSLKALPDWGVHFGGFLLLEIVRVIFTPVHGFFPPSNELYHYPFLAIGWFAMVVTSLNLLPLGQLDGGHITYAMFGPRQRHLGRWFARFLLFVGLGWIGSMLLDATRTASADPVFRFLQGIFGPVMELVDRYAPWWFTGSPIWLVWSLIVRFLLRVEHPPIPDPEPLDRRRMVIGWCAIAMLALTFSYSVISDRGTPDNAPATTGATAAAASTVR